MLKKLVKYGNSNAIVLDKPILELLAIEEGSTIKISTDGKSLILTPTEKANNSMIHQTYTPRDALLEIRASALAKTLNLSEEERNKIYHLMIHQKECYEKLSKNKEYLAKSIEIGAKYKNNPISAEFQQELKSLLKTYDESLYQTMQELSEIEKRAESKYFVSEEHQTRMKEEFSSFFNKNKEKIDDKKIQEEISSPEYIHATQLAAEKFKITQNIEQFGQEMLEASQKYAPTLSSIQEEVKAVQKSLQNQSKND